MSQMIASLQKSLNLIEELSSHGSDIGMSDLARRLGLTKNQVYRILKTLEAYDYVHQLDGKTYELGYKFFEIGQRLLSRNELVQVATLIMDELRDATGESVHLLVRDGLEAVCVAKRDSPATLRMSAQVGARFLFHAGACPKAISAFQSSDLIDAAVSRYGLPTYTIHTVSSRAALDEHLTMIRRAGYAESEEDIDLHVYAIAVPIYDRDGLVNAAMSVAGPIQRIDRSMRARVLACLVPACDRISAALGAPKHLSSGIATYVVTEPIVEPTNNAVVDGTGRERSRYATIDERTELG